MSRNLGSLAAALLCFALRLQMSADAQGPGAASTAGLAVTSGHSAAVWYRAVNIALADAYDANRLLDPTGSSASSQRCLRTDNTMSSRPSPLVHPPLSQAAIAQRRTLVAALIAYSVALAALADNEPQSNARSALTDARNRARDLSAAAQRHGSGDLFIDDLAATFFVDVGHFAAGGRSAGTQRQAAAAQPTIAKLSAILTADAAQRRAQALNAARFDYQTWLTVYNARRDASRAAALPRPTPLPLARCFEPALAATDSLLVLRDVADDGRSFPGRQSIRARLTAVQKRYVAIERADFAELIASTGALNEAAFAVLAGELRGGLDPQRSRIGAAERAFSSAITPLQ